MNQRDLSDKLVEVLTLTEALTEACNKLIRAAYRPGADLEFLRAHLPDIELTLGQLDVVLAHKITDHPPYD